MKKDDRENIYSSSGNKKNSRPLDSETYFYISRDKVKANPKDETFNDEEFRRFYGEAKYDRKKPTQREMKIQKKIYAQKKKKSVFKRFVLILLALILAFGLIVTGLFFYYFGGLKTDKTFTTSPEDLGLSSSQKINNRVTNIALFGIDTRNNDDVSGRSDTTMVASFDGVHHQIKLISLLRDSRVNIDGHGKDKLCHAYSYGGPELAVKTINQNYKLDIMEYITVNFEQMAEIIDAIGGVDITLTQKECVAANGLIASTPELSYSEPIKSFDEKEATVHLNGAQAVSYARIRKIDSEVQRAGRQQTVLQAMFDKITKMGIWEYPKLIKELFPYVYTSLNYIDLLKLVPTVLASKNTIKDYTIPDATDKGVFGGNVNGVWYWVYDLDKYAANLYDFIYNQS